VNLDLLANLLNLPELVAAKLGGTFCPILQGVAWFNQSRQRSTQVKIFFEIKSPKGNLFLKKVFYRALPGLTSLDNVLRRLKYFLKLNPRISAWIRLLVPENQELLLESRISCLKNQELLLESRISCLKNQAIRLKKQAMVPENQGLDPENQEFAWKSRISCLKNQAIRFCQKESFWADDW
jgi:hypothetical protein